MCSASQRRLKAIRQEWWTGDALPRPHVVRRELIGVPKIQVVDLSKEKVEAIVLGEAVTPGEGRAGPSAQEMAYTICAKNGTKWT